MITYIPYVPIAQPEPHYGGGTVIPLYCYLPYILRSLGMK